MPNAQNLVGHGFDSKPERINKKGRPKKLPELDALIVELLGERKVGESRMREVLASLIEQAVGGNLRAAEIVLTRAYGKPKEHVEITSNGETFERQKTTIIFSDDSLEDENRLILGAAGDVRDKYGNFICLIPTDKMHLFQFDIHFVGNDGLQALDYDGTGIVSTKDD
jgi:hypothetical protein